MRLSCTRCVASNNTQSGFRVTATAGATGIVTVSASKATFNGMYGFHNGGGDGAAMFRTTGDNHVDLNFSGGVTGPITPVTPT